MYLIFDLYVILLKLHICLKIVVKLLIVTLTSKYLQLGGGTMTGALNITGTVTANGKNIGSTHTHGGVQTGGGTTGVVS